MIIMLLKLNKNISNCLLLLFHIQHMTYQTDKVILFLAFIFIFNQQTNCQDQFNKRNSFSLGSYVTSAKFSADYTLLAVIRSGEKYIYSFNPYTFELIGSHPLDDGFTPMDLQIFGSHIIVLTEQNQVLVFERKINSGDLAIKQKVNLKYQGLPVALKLQKLNEDFSQKSDPSKSRHLVVWHRQNFQVFTYFAGKNQSIVTELFDKTIQPQTSALTDLQFFDETYLVYGLSLTNTTGQTYALQLKNFSSIHKVDSKLSNSFKAFAIKSLVGQSLMNYLAIGQADNAIDSKSGNKNIKEGNAISNLKYTKIFYDNNKLIGFYNQQSIEVYRATELTSIIGFPNYTLRYKQTKKPDDIGFSIVSMPQKNTGEFISNNCYENHAYCFYYYSICDPGTYYSLTTLLNETCKKCNVANCSKCYIQNQCVACSSGNFVSNNKCSICNTFIYGCIECSQTGKICSTCDSKALFNSTPINNTCICIKGYAYKNSTKQCAQCKSSISYCLTCDLSPDNSFHCNSCDQSTNRIPSNDGKACICYPNFYFQTVSKQCQLCDPNKKCKRCTNQTICLQCDAQQNWQLNIQSKCQCVKGWVQVNNHCLLCNLQGCDTCETQTQCKVCFAGFHLDKDKNCVCDDDKYLNNQTKKCDKCSQIKGCSKCSNNTACLQCNTSLHRNETPTKNGQCLCQVKYNQNTQNQCVLCTTTGCLNCEAENICKSCDSTRGFNQTIINGKCSCLESKYLDVSSCKNCNDTLTGCELCNNEEKCSRCNSTLNFAPTPQQGQCKCMTDFFFLDNLCLKCQVIYQHCQKCILIVNNGQLLTVTVGCSQCEDGFEVKDSKCLQKQKSYTLFILIGIGILTMILVLGICWFKKRRSKKREQKKRREKQSQSSIVSQLLKGSSPDVITIDRTSVESKKIYQSLFSGNINYSISSQEKQSDKKIFNQSLKKLEKQKKKQYERKKQKQTYLNLTQKIKTNQKSLPTEEEDLSLKKLNLFSQRGKQ